MEILFFCDLFGHKTLTAQQQKRNYHNQCCSKIHYGLCLWVASKSAFKVFGDSVTVGRKQKSNKGVPEIRHLKQWLIFCLHTTSNYILPDFRFWMSAGNPGMNFTRDT
jgi:hypothetical protein